MRIESGTTGERRIRTLIVLTMCAVFAGWFAYDGLRGWPNKNLEWALKEWELKALPKPDAPKINPRVTADHLKRIVEAAGMPRGELDALLGEPALEQKKQLTYVGSDMKATIRLADGKVVDVTTGPLEPADKSVTPIYTLPDRIKKIHAGMSEAEVETELGKSRNVREQTLWYVGPAAYAEIQVADGKTLGKPKIQLSTEHTESDIFMQKVLATGLTLISLFMAFKFYQVVTLRAVLDDTGLTINRKHVPWDAMTGLKVDEYVAKGWVDLICRTNGDSRPLRLDSYHINHFKGIVLAICERKDFVPPPFSQPSGFPTDSA